MALARGQELVAQSKGEGVRLAGAIRQGAIETPADRVSLHGPEVRLSAETAVNMMLAFHELAANAMSHGALASPGGRVEISWLVAGGQLELEWREVGGPQGEAAGKPGFGFKMLQTGLPRSLAGVADLYFGPGGLHYRIFAPLSPAIRAEASTN
jgi:two-component sensor histidine kinase